MNHEDGAWVRWYAVMVQIEHETQDGWSGSRQVPLFYLDSHVQGITSLEHATQVARDIVSGAGLFDSERVTFHITAQPADQLPHWAQERPNSSTVDGAGDGAADRHPEPGTPARIHVAGRSEPCPPQAFQD